MPLVICPSGVGEIAAGLIQRATLLDARAAPTSTARAAWSPRARCRPPLVAGSPISCAPWWGVETRGGRRLQVYAADLGRGPDGRWWVLGDRAQAPSGMGYALENRIALSPRPAGTLRAHERAAARAVLPGAGASALAAQAGRGDDPRIGLLTPGPLNETYFEHAYLSRYLGFLLVEGGDLTVRDGTRLCPHHRRAEARRRAGAPPRLRSSPIPSSSNASSQIGVPGLVQAVRTAASCSPTRWAPACWNRARCSASCRRCAERILGEPLKLPNIATWWCGQDARSAPTCSTPLDELALAPPSPRPDWPFPPGPLLGAALEPATTARAARADRTSRPRRRRPGGRAALDHPRLARRPAAAAALHAARLCRRHARRLGGDARRRSAASPTAATPAPSPCSSAAARPTSGCPRTGPVEPRHAAAAAGPACRSRRVIGYLPSRAAENLFWLGRYLERAEATSCALSRARSPAGEHRDAAARPARPCTRLIGLLIAWGAAAPAAPARGAPARRSPVTPPRPSTRRSATRARRLRPVAGGEARRTASVIRDRLSPDAVRALADLAALLRPHRAHRSTGEALETADHALRIMAAFSGLVQENMNRALRLALPGDRPAHRARHPHRPLSSAASPTARRRRPASTRCWS